MAPGREDSHYRVPGTLWADALPMGDGRFGAMAHQQGDALNHYDLYLAFNDATIPPPDLDPWDIARRAQAAHEKARVEGEEVASYTSILSASEFEDYGLLRRGQWMNVAGRLQMHCKHSPHAALQFEQRLNL